MSHLEHRSVAGSFLFKYPSPQSSSSPSSSSPPPSSSPSADKPLVALFRRSSQVKTYPGKLAPLAGSIEPTDPSPLHAAVREIREETTLSPPGIRLLRQGKPYTFNDHSAGRSWTIHPFGFLLADEQAERAIKLDWEHDGYEWFALDDVAAVCEKEGVPNLLKSLRRVYFDIDLGAEAGGILAEGLAELRDDQVNGARELARKGFRIFTRVVGTLEEGDAWWDNVRFLGWHLWKNGRESMGAAIGAVVFRALSIAEEGHQQGAGADGIVKLLEAYAGEKEREGLRISDHLVDYLNAHYDKTGGSLNVLTLSSSSTINKALIRGCLQAGGFKHKINLRILESRPLFEGVSSASHLRKEISRDILPLSIYTDAAVADAARDIDVLLLGADLITSSGAFSNKMGSLPAVLAARHVSPGAKILVVAGTDKVMPSDDDSAVENEMVAAAEKGSKRAVAKAWEERPAKGISIENRTFEWVPGEFVDGYVTERGVLGRDKMRELAREGKARERRFFDGL